MFVVVANEMTHDGGILFDMFKHDLHWFQVEDLWSFHITEDVILCWNIPIFWLDKPEFNGNREVGNC